LAPQRASEDQSAGSMRQVFVTERENIGRPRHWRFPTFSFDFKV
jgi:hypothetical protein